MKPALHRDRAASCEGKQALSIDLAKQIAKKQHAGAKPYHCQHCGAWHPGQKLRKSLPKPKRREW